jgi:hypothetical protein
MSGICASVCIRMRALPKFTGTRNGVFFGVSQLVHGPNGVVPSLVWLEASKERADLCGQIIFEAIGSVEPVIQIGGKREGNELVGVSAGSVPHGNGVSHLIETRPEIVDRIEHDARNVIREAFAEDEYLEVITSLRITLDGMGVRLVWVKTLIVVSKSAIWCFARLRTLLALAKISCMAKPDPTKDAEFQKVVPHF